MNSIAQDLLALVARVLLAWMFLVAGYGKIGGFEGTVGYIASKGLPLPQLVAVGTIVLEIVAALALIIGYKARWAALALALFTVLATLIFHNYWAMPEAQQRTQELMFLKNLAVTGGMLMVAAFGAGRISLDGRRR
jgi:putative oxidoreductase